MDITVSLAEQGARRLISYSYGHLLVITGYFSGIIHVINGVISYKLQLVKGHNCIRAKEATEISWKRIGTPILVPARIAFEWQLG